MADNQSIAVKKTPVRDLFRKRWEARKIKSKHTLNLMKQNKEKYVMLAPFMLLFTVFTVLPVLISIFFSFTNFNMLEFPNFIGFDNYKRLFLADDIFLIAIKNTIILALITGPLSYVMCFVFAWLINELKRPLRVFLTVVFYAPSISGNAYLIWKLIFSSDMYGYANSWLMDMGIINEPILWMQDTNYIMPILIIVQLWLSLGVSFLSFIAGLQTVDKTLYESGAIDGIRNRWQELWYITLPSMKPQLLFGAVMQITTSLSISSISIELAGFPSVEYAGHTIVTHLYDYGSVRYEMGYASAIASLLFFVMIFTNLIVQKLLRKVGR